MPIVKFAEGEWTFMRQGLHQTQNQNSWSWNKGNGFFSNLFKWKSVFSSSHSARPSATWKKLNSCNKKENSGNKSYIFCCGFVLFVPFDSCSCGVSFTAAQGTLQQGWALWSQHHFSPPPTSFHAASLQVADPASWLCVGWGYPEMPEMFN